MRRLIPFLQIYDKELYKSNQYSALNYIGDPLVAVKIFNELKAMEIIISDTSPCKNGNLIDFKLIKNIAEECFMPVTYSGGIKDISEAYKILSLGVEKICVNSGLYNNPRLLKSLVDEFGTSTIVSCIEIRNINNQPCVFYQSGKKRSKDSLPETLKKFQDYGTGEIFLIDIERDGTMSGGNEDLVNSIKDYLKVPLIYAGGIGKAEHCLKLFNAGASAVAVGSAFVYKSKLNGVLINYPDHKYMSLWTGEKSFLL